MERISRSQPYLILGALGFGSFTTHKEAQNIMSKAFELGIRDIDCGQSYGLGHARKVIGEFHRNEGVNFNIWEKFGLVMDKDVENETRARVSFQSARSSSNLLENICEVYGLENIFNLQVHAPIPVPERNQVLEFLAEAMSHNRVQNIGISNHETWEMAELEDELGNFGVKIGSNQVHANIAEQRAFSGIIKESYSRGIPVIANRVLARGLLSHLDFQDSKRSTVSTKLRRHQLENEEHFASVLKILRRRVDRPVSETAISWIIQQKEIAGVILGVSTLKQLESATLALQYPISPEAVSGITADLATRFGEDLFKLPLKMLDTNY
jgi:aryl-alcohol dehydrogenase-like predicted oxidoreductase